MARIRKIRPQFFEDPDMAALAFPVRLLFIALWTMCDARGLMAYDVREIRRYAFGYDDVSVSDVEGWLLRLQQDKDGSGRKFVEVYEVDGKQYLRVVNFLRHQVHGKSEWGQMADSIKNGRALPEPLDGPRPWHRHLEKYLRPSKDGPEVDPKPFEDGLRTKKEEGTWKKEHGGGSTRVPPEEDDARKICLRLQALHEAKPQTFAKCPPTIPNIDEVTRALNDLALAETIDDALAELEKHGCPEFWTRGKFGLTALLKHAPKIARGEWHGGAETEEPEMSEAEWRAHDYAVQMQMLAEEKVRARAEREARAKAQAEAEAKAAAKAASP